MDSKKLADMMAAYPVTQTKNKDGTESGRYVVFGRLHWPSLDRPTAGPNGGGEKWRLTLILPAGYDVTLLNRASQVAALGKWPNASDMVKGGRLRMPLRSQSEKPDTDGFEWAATGGKFFNASANATTKDGKPMLPPTLLGRGLELIPNASSGSAFYAGVWVRAKINFWPYSQAGNSGVAVGFSSVQIIETDERLRTSSFDPADGLTAVAGASPSGVAALAADEQW